jgi:4-diphosphocytidyl-2-C-methyl-D-erythritol kinase
MSVSVFAPAKINLTLEVGRPAASGLHPLQSVVVFADIGDIVTATPGDRLSLALEGDFAAGLDGEEDNLVLRAARALASHARRPELGATLRLEKNLPIASGMGGGSSDAAAALKALNALWGLKLSARDLEEVAAPLGADAPVCVAARPAYMTGFGQSFTPISAPSFAAVLVNPLTPAPTGEVYGQFDRMDLGGAFAARAAPQWASAEAALNYIAAAGNDLAPAAAAVVPVIGEIAAALAALNEVRYAALSGSGATMFALVDDEASAEMVADALRARYPAWWIMETTLGGA